MWTSTALLRWTKWKVVTKESENTYRDSLRETVINLPETPGCYQYLDETGKVIYVGKAKNLKRRVSSYFNKEHESAKTRMLVSKIRDLKYVVVRTEWDALLLENNLIKKYKPRYNILLKDDKTYPSICITKEEFPRIFKTRNIIRNGSEYYGPYSHVATLNGLMELIGKLYRIRRCRFPMTEAGIADGRYKDCLEYQIKNCNAPCIGNETREEYLQQIEEIREILKGKSGWLIQKLKEKMKALAAELKFEEAQQIKVKIDILSAFREKSMVVTEVPDDLDVFSGEQDEDGTVFINYMHVTEGCINQAFTFEFKNRIEEPLSELIMSSVVEMRNRYGSKASEIVLPFMPETEIEGITWTVPQRGERKKLLTLSELNVKQYRADRLKKSDKLNPQQKHVRLLKELQKVTGMEKLPYRIECFDNSHIHGSDAVAACVVYEEGKPLRKEYRLYNIKSGAGGDDYASMIEVLTRRYRRIIDEEGRMPDLVIVDGGKPQMSAATEVMNSLGLELDIAGLVKNSHHRTSGLIVGKDRMEVGIKPDSELFRLLEQMQDEVHRVAISFHKNKRSRRQTESELTRIAGIGDKTASLLLREFKSVKRISEADEESLTKVIGRSKATVVYSHFNGKS